MCSLSRFEPEREHLTYWDGGVSANMSPRFDGIGALGVFGSVTARAPNSAAKSSETHQTSRFMTIKPPTAGSRLRHRIRAQSGCRSRKPKGVDGRTGLIAAPDGD
jgi:hypothetical protein